MRYNRCIPSCCMPQENGIKIAAARRELVDRIAASAYLSRSVRLRELLVYLTDRVLEGEAAEVHEQEVGHRVFGRPLDYDTGADNIVRVHASTLRKRLEQYFAAEGANEPVVLEIPKGNYTPVFRERPRPAVPAPRAVAKRPLWGDWHIWVLAAAALTFAACTVALFMAHRGTAERPTVRQFWSLVFPSGRTTDVVLDDAGIALYQELTGKRLALSEYFDRTYLGSVAAGDTGKLDAQTASTMVLRRQSSYASTSFVSKLLLMPGVEPGRALLRFARDYSFHDLKSDSAVLLGNAITNPWIQPLESQIGLRWQYDSEAGIYYPVDAWNGNKSYR